MADWLVQRYVPNLPNETAGGWVDEGTVSELKSNEAVDQLADPDYPDATRRAVRWDTTEEFETVPSPPKVTKGVKRARTPEDP